MSDSRLSASDMAFLQALGGKPWTSPCGRVTASRGHMMELDYDAFIDPAYDYWLVSYTADAGNSQSITLRDGDLPPDQVAIRLHAKIDEYEGLLGAEPT